MRNFNVNIIFLETKCEGRISRSSATYFIMFFVALA